MENTSQNNLDDSSEENATSSESGKLREPISRKRRPFRRVLPPGQPEVLIAQADKMLDQYSHVRAQVVTPTPILPGDATEAFLSRIPVSKAMEILEGLLNAESTIFDLAANKLITRPDNATRFKAWQEWVHMVYGKPIERRIIENHNVDSMDDLEKKLASNPALCESLERMLAKAKEKK